jgi:hypothetical protein
MSSNTRLKNFPFASAASRKAFRLAGNNEWKLNKNQNYIALLDDGTRLSADRLKCVAFFGITVGG